MQKTNTLSKQRGKTTDLVIQAMLVALVFISTIFLNIKLPIASNGGLVHLGTAMLFIASILFGYGCRYGCSWTCVEKTHNCHVAYQSGRLAAVWIFPPFPSDGGSWSDLL